MVKDMRWAAISVCSFSLATTERFKNNQGQQQERTEWHNIVVWGKLAEVCGTYLHKGKQVYIEGKIQTSKWQDKDGNDRYTTDGATPEATFSNQCFFHNIDCVFYNMSLDFSMNFRNSVVRLLRKPDYSLPFCCDVAVIKNQPVAFRNVFCALVSLKKRLNALPTKIIPKELI